MKPLSCLTCVKHRADMAANGEMVMFCCAKPPTVAAGYMQAPKGMQLLERSVWPQVTKDQWCAEHQDFGKVDLN